MIFGVKFSLPPRSLSDLIHSTWLGGSPIEIYKGEIEWQLTDMMVQMVRGDTLSYPNIYRSPRLQGHQSSSGADPGIFGGLNSAASGQTF